MKLADPYWPLKSIEAGRSNRLVILNRTFLTLSSQLILPPIEFIDENGGGSGVRLRKRSTPSKVAIIGARKIFPIEFKRTTVSPSVVRRV